MTFPNHEQKLYAQSGVLFLMYNFCDAEGQSESWKSGGSPEKEWFGNSVHVDMNSFLILFWTKIYLNVVMDQVVVLMLNSGVHFFVTSRLAKKAGIVKEKAHVKDLYENAFL